MSEPSGLLIWGQAGEFDAPDDRAVIAAIAGDRGAGLVAGARLTAGAGLAVNIEPGWFGVASCDDGTSAVVGSRFPLTVQANTGPATGSRTDYLWCDTFPDESEYLLVIVPAAETAGRAGLRLATIVVPAGANLASQMDLSPAPADFWHWPGLAIAPDLRLETTPAGLLYVTSAATGQGGAAEVARTESTLRSVTAAGNYANPIGAPWTLPAGDSPPGTRYRISLFGVGNMGAGGDSAYSFALAGIASGPEPYIGAGGGGTGANVAFGFTVIAEIQVTTVGNTCNIAMRAHHQGDTGTRTGVTGFGVRHNLAFNPPITVEIRAQFVNAATGRVLNCQSNLFERIAGGGPVARPSGAPRLAATVSERRAPRGRMVPVG